MLLSFRVANHRSIRNSHAISLVATEFNEGSARPTGVRAEGRPIDAVPVVGIFGANASGKSNLVDALHAMREAVRTSLADWAQAAEVPREPFALDPNAREETSLFEVDLLLGQHPVRYTYGFELSDQRVEAEWLHAYPHGRRQIWFDREAGRDGGEEFLFPGDGLKGGKDKLARFTRPNSLFLTVAASFNHPQLSSLHRWFLDGLAIMKANGDGAHGTPSTRDLLTGGRRSARVQRRIESMLQVADLGLVGIEVNPALRTHEQIRLLHHSNAGEPVAMDLMRQESQGTVAWFGFLGPLIDVLDRGAVLIVDELDASLHPMLAAEVIRLFQDPVANPNNAQLIFTTHDATLLGTSLVDRPLDRDQVWLTTKQRTGETEVYPLIDARPRREENLERGYLRGRYGGVPRVTTGELARAVAQTAAETA